MTMICANAIAVAASSVPETILLEAEQFNDTGGWKTDTQFIDIMGSPYLLAHGLGHPVRNAKTTVELQQGGTYTVWARTRNWVPGKWQAPGRFKIVINGTPITTVFGTVTGWQWQKGATVTLPKGKATLELQDLTGFDGRCDAVLLTTDPAYKPDNSNQPLNDRRCRLPGIENATMEKHYDLVVVGGGLAGIGSAISAARMGLSVALIQDRPVPGGNGSSEIRVAPRGNYPDGLYPFGDLVKEFSPRVKLNVGTAGDYYDKLRERKIREEKNIDLFLNHYAYKVLTKDKRITAVIALAVRNKQILEFHGDYFVDATGHGRIGYWAGADYRMQPKDRMGMSNLWRWRFTDHPVSFPHLPWALQLDEKGFPYPQDGRAEWFWESGFDKDPLKDLEDIRDHNLRAAYGAWDAIKNKGAYASKDPSGQAHAAAELTWVAYIGGTRETLQLLGDVVLTKKDVLTGRKFDDACVLSTWGLDLHYAHPLYKKETPDDPFISRAHFGGRVDDSKGPLSVSPTHYVSSKAGHGFDRKKGYAVPYRCFYSRNISNLFMAGRDMSVTHEALGTVRVMQTLGMCGVAIGRAAYVCKKEGVSPRRAYRRYLPELKETWSLPADYRCTPE